MNTRQFIGLVSLTAPLLATSIDAKAADGNLAISGYAFGNNQLVVSTSNRNAGAISSVVYRGLEHIDQTDHGRELQSAVQFDGLGECWNPTEAGSAADGSGSTSTSVLLASTLSPNRLATSTQMAYWLSAGAAYPQGCGDRPWVTSAYNQTNLSSDVLDKSVTIGFNGLPNVIEHLVTFHTYEGHGSIVFEALTGYMPSLFSQPWTYDPATISLSSSPVAPGGGGEQSLPVILSTADGNFAMGIYSPDLPQSGVGYGRFNFGSVMKWNAVYRRNGGMSAGAYGFRQYVVVGSRSEVAQGISAVYQMFQSRIANVYRFYAPATGEHFFTLSTVEGGNAGFAAEQVGFMVLANPTGGTMPLYRCNYGKHFASTDPRCEGTVNEGQYGHIYGSQVAGSTPLYRFVQPSTGDHLETTNYNEGVGAGYNLEGVLGYVPTQAR